MWLRVLYYLRPRYEPRQPQRGFPREPGVLIYEANIHAFRRGPLADKIPLEVGPFLPLLKTSALLTMISSRNIIQRPVKIDLFTFMISSDVPDLPRFFLRFKAVPDSKELRGATSWWPERDHFFICQLLTPYRPEGQRPGGHVDLPLW